MAPIWRELFGVVIGKFSVDCCLMSGLWLRRRLPLALMKLADLVPICLPRIKAHDSKRVFLIAGTTVLPSFRVALANFKTLRFLLLSIHAHRLDIMLVPDVGSFPFCSERPKRSVPSCSQAQLIPGVPVFVPTIR